MKILLKIFSILLLIIGLALTAALFLAFSDMRFVGASAIGEPQQTVDAQGNVHLIVKLRVYNNGSYLTMANSKVEMKIIDQNNNTISSDTKVFTLGPKSYTDLTFDLVIPNATFVKFANGEIRLFVSTKLTAVMAFRDFVLLTYSLESISELQR